MSDYRAHSKLLLTCNQSHEQATVNGAKGYTKLVIALIDRCLASNRANHQYGSVLDVANLIPLEKYKIDSLTY